MTGPWRWGAAQRRDSAPGQLQEARSDQQLLADHIGGDPRAFTELVRRHSDRMWAVALRTTRDPEDAADALQEALLSAHRAAESFRADAEVSTWLHRIVVNSCLDRLRRRSARPTVSLDSDDVAEPADQHDRLAEQDMRMIVHRALLQIPLDQRAAIVAVDVEGYSVAEAARILGVAEGTVKSRCARGRVKLAVLLGHLRSGEPATVRNPEPLRRVETSGKPRREEDR